VVDHQKRMNAGDPDIGGGKIGRRRFVGTSVGLGLASVITHLLPPSLGGTGAAEAACGGMPPGWPICQWTFVWAAYCECCSPSGGPGISIQRQMACYTGGSYWTSLFECCCWTSGCAPCDGRYLGDDYRC
jgi:hypothetical protein